VQRTLPRERLPIPAIAALERLDGDDLPRSEGQEKGVALRVVLCLIALAALGGERSVGQKRHHDFGRRDHHAVVGTHGLQRPIGADS
jgi:hypothetical protein